MSAFVILLTFTSEDVHGNEKLRRFTPHERLDSRTRRRAGAAVRPGLEVGRWRSDDIFLLLETLRADFGADLLAMGTTPAAIVARAVPLTTSAR